MCGSAEWKGWDLSIKSIEDREQANVDLKNKLQEITGQTPNSGN